MTPYRGIEAVRVVGPTALEVSFTGGWQATVELEGWIGAAAPALEPLRDPAVFGTARVTYWGSGVAWGAVLDQEDRSGAIDIGGDQLWRLAGEQAGLLMPTAAFRAWRARHGLTLDQAARALGLSRRLVAYYESGARPVPRTVLLACKGYDALTAERPAA